jgi:hypothetical protein
LKVPQRFTDRVNEIVGDFNPLYQPTQELGLKYYFKGIGKVKREVLLRTIPTVDPEKGYPKTIEAAQRVAGEICDKVAEFDWEDDEDGEFNGEVAQGIQGEKEPMAKRNSEPQEVVKKILRPWEDLVERAKVGGPTAKDNGVVVVEKESSPEDMAAEIEKRTRTLASRTG